MYLVLKMRHWRLCERPLLSPFRRDGAEASGPRPLGTQSRAPLPGPSAPQRRTAQTPTPTPVTCTCSVGT